MPTDIAPRERAIRTVLYTLRSPLSLLCIPERENAIALAKEHAITAEELLEYATKLARNA